MLKRDERKYKDRKEIARILKSLDYQLYSKKFNQFKSLGYDFFNCLQVIHLKQIDSERLKRKR